jgi:uncharacterized protein with PIN domain
VGRAYFRVYAELNDHLPPLDRFKTLEKDFTVSSTVKDMIESFGVPHAEIDLIVANGESVGFDYRVRDGDRVAVYPVFEALDIRPELRVRVKPLREPRFVLDVHLGKLAAYLRMLGFDAMYRSCFSDPELVRISSDERRILLTRDRGLLKHAAVTHGYWLRETDSRRQAAEVVRRFDLAAAMRPFTRCMECNGVLEPISIEAAREFVPERVVAALKEFRRCPRCGRIFWKGSHYDRMRRFVEELSTSCATG